MENKDEAAGNRDKAEHGQENGEEGDIAEVYRQRERVIIDRIGQGYLSCVLPTLPSSLSRLFPF